MTDAQRPDESYRIPKGLVRGGMRLVGAGLFVAAVTAGGVMAWPALVERWNAEPKAPAPVVVTVSHDAVVIKREQDKNVRYTFNGRPGRLPLIYDNGWVLWNQYPNGRWKWSKDPEIEMLGEDGGNGEEHAQK